MVQNPRTAKAHADRVKAVSQTVRQYYEQNIPFRIFHGSSNSTRAAARQQVVDISSLNHILHIDHTNKTALVEPGIAMDALVRALLPHKLIPAVVPEFPGITAGGAFAGTAAESSSFRHGYFDASVREIEVVLGNGDVVLASPEHNEDLFYGCAGAMGALGAGLRCSELACVLQVVTQTRMRGRAPASFCIWLNVIPTIILQLACCNIDCVKC